MGVVLRRYIDFLIISLILTPLVLALLLLCSLKKKFVLVYVIFVQYSKRCSKNIQKSRSRGHGDIIISTRTYVHYKS